MDEVLRLAKEWAVARGRYKSAKAIGLDAKGRNSGRPLGDLYGEELLDVADRLERAARRLP